MTSEIVHVAVAVVERHGKFLIARRPPQAHQGDLLEFPGGKVEPGESVQQALARELAEETGITVVRETLSPLIGIRHNYGDKQVFLDVWRVGEHTGEARGLEGQPLFWMSANELKDQDFPEANRPIIRAVRLPNRLAITGVFESLSQGVDQLRVSLQQRQPEWVLLRAPWLSPEDYRRFVDAAVVLTRGTETRLLVHDRSELVASYPVAGVHLSQRVARTMTGRPVASDKWLGVSCHNGSELTHAAHLGADYGTLSPVLPTPTHPDANPLGWNQFQALVDAAVLPVYALGGLGDTHVGQAREAGAQGVAGISSWWSEPVQFS